ncbi:protein dpy-30 homolog [Rhopilema esculentum]|uniref:protein dpy-30 homolog n=1 Tax=Rhopilema esculentum TaxID=499914 RepID=UPI0031D112DF
MAPTCIHGHDAWTKLNFCFDWLFYGNKSQTRLIVDVDLLHYWREMAADGHSGSFSIDGSKTMSSSGEAEQGKDELNQTSSPMTEAGLTDTLQKIISEEKDATDPKKARRDVRWMSTRPYLDQTVVPILLQGLIALSKERPPDPIEYLATFLLRNKNAYENNQPPS